MTKCLRLDSAPGTHHSVEILLENHSARVPGATEAEYNWLFSYLVIRTPRFTRDRYSGRTQYDGEDHQHLFDFESESFPTGFVDQVARKAAAHGFTVNVRDKRVAPAEPDPKADVHWLMEHQHYCLAAAINRKRGIIHGATGMGKTEVIVALLRVFPDLKFLILVHRAKLMKDIRARAYLRAKEHGYPEPEDIGLYGDEYKELGRRVTIATFQSIHAHKRNPAVKKLLESTQALIIDEAHTAAAGTFTSIVEKCPNAYYRWGVSGTPLDRSDRRSNIVIGLLGPVIARVSAKELIDKGLLARPTVRFVRFDAPDVYAGEWARAREQGIVESRARNQAVLHATRRASKPCMLFVDIIEHGEFLTKRLQQAGITAEFVWAKAKTKQREDALERLIRADVDVVVTSPVFNEGIDLPDLRSVVLAAGGKSVIAVLQRIGRGMRATADKKTFEVWDFEDMHHRILEDHMVQRRRAYKREGHEILIDTEVLSLPRPQNTPANVPVKSGAKYASA